MTVSSFPQGSIAAAASAGADVLSLTTQTISDFGAGGLPAQAGLRIGTNGYVYEYSAGGGYSIINTASDWILPRTNMANYSVRFTKTSGTGTLSGVTSGTWYACTANRDPYCLNNSYTGMRNVVMTVDLALTSDTTTVLESKTYTFQSSWEP